LRFSSYVPKSDSTPSSGTGIFRMTVAGGMV
jgi:hypothetical protein